MAKYFSKQKWLERAKIDKDKGVLTQREIDDALSIWVNAFDGKSKEEISEDFLNDDLFVEV